LTGRLANALQDAVASDPVMQAFRRRFPDAPIETTQLSLCLPEPVYTLFAADRSLDARLRILVMSHLGGTYFEEFVSARAGRIARASLPRAGWIDNVTSLRVRATSADVGHIDRETLVARGLSPAHVSQMLAKAIEDDSGRYLDKCHKLFRRVARRDLVGNLRGVWSLTTGSGTGS